MGYYFKGVQSWSWFFPHHYAPFPRDILLTLELMVTERLGDLKDSSESDDSDVEDAQIALPVRKRDKKKSKSVQIDHSIRLSKRDVSRLYLDTPLFTFDLSAPLLPFQQLLAVLPPERYFLYFKITI